MGEFFEVEGKIEYQGDDLQQCLQKLPVVKQILEVSFQDRLANIKGMMVLFFNGC